jgi:murein L,D-transpeptidase YcbB/YkuD
MRRVPLLILLPWMAAMAAPTVPSRDLDPFASFVPALERYRAIQADGGWPMLPAGPSLHPGDTDPAIPLLRTRLAVSGDLPDPTPPAGIEPALYDTGLAPAVRAFQRRHGLIDDGVIGRHTRAALNVSVGERIRQLELNRKRLEQDEILDHDRLVRVNIPGYALSLYEHGREVLQMPVVVGRRDRPTPELRSRITFLVVNPTWTIPTTLAYEDYLPKVRRDPNYFREHDIRVFEGWTRGADEINPDWIDWNLIGRSIKSLKLRQAPGPENPLGRIKFFLPNDHDIYLHDTPSRALMRRDHRTFSSGCIRVGDARALAEALLTREPNWPPERLERTLEAGETVEVRFSSPVPVVLTYQTAWVSADGTVNFRADVYDHEDDWAASLAAEAQERPSTSPTAPEQLGRATPAPIPAR